MSDFDESAALDAAAGPGATAILHGMLRTLSEVLERLDERLGRLEARAATPPVEVDVEHIAETVLDRLRGDPTLERVVAAAGEQVRHAVDDLRAQVADRRTDEEIAGLRRSFDEALMALGDRNEAHAVGVRTIVEQLSDELRRLADSDDADEPMGPDIPSLLADVGQGTERSLARLHADLRGAVEELALAMAERHDGQAAALTRVEAELRTAIGAQAGAVHDIQVALGDRLEAELRTQVAPLHETLVALAERVEAGLQAAAGAQAGALHEVQTAVVERLEGAGSTLERLRAEVSAQAFALEQLRTDAGEHGPVPVDGIHRVEASLARLHAELDDHSAGQVALVDRLVADQAAALSRVEAETRDAIGAVRAELAARPDAAALAAEHADALRRALEEAITTLAERQAATNASLVAAVDRLRAEVAPTGEAEAVADLLARHAGAARDDLARIETVLRGQVAEVSGRAGSMTDVIGRLDGRLHEVVDGVRALSRHLEATASLVPAVEALRAEVDELRRLSEQPRLRAVNGGTGD
ncbi:MAG: hypothetical protein KY443_07330 [Actinobacteria bacterium]|nr:hypothetical protein [Actinomycetota bacterium]